MIDVDWRFEQPPHDRDIATVSGADEPGAVVGVLGVDIGAVSQRQLEQAWIVADLTGRDQVGVC